VKCALDSRRPWHALGRNSDARVCRAHANRKVPGVEFYTEPGSASAMVFDECDAKVFAGILNTVRRTASQPDAPGAKGFSAT
jgi:hypothetical protein